MGGRGGKGRSRSRPTLDVPDDPLLPPGATARPDDPEEPGPVREDPPDPARYQPDVTPAADPGPVPRTPEEIDAHITETAKSFQNDPWDYVNLANVRAALHPDLDRATVDAALQRLNRMPGVTFAPEEDQKLLTQPERDAALRVGVQDTHLITFTPNTAAPEPPSAPPSEHVRAVDKPYPGDVIADLQRPTYTGPPPSGDADVEAHVVQVARGFERDPGDYINLANVRAALHPGLDRATVDAALRRLNQRRDAVVVPDDDQAGMHPAERAAAVRIGNQDNHFISFDDHNRGTR